MKNKEVRSKFIHFRANSNEKVMNGELSKVGINVAEEYRKLLKILYTQHVAIRK